jgi:hypothetical protein
VFGLRQAEGSLLLAGYLMQIGGNNGSAQFAFGLAGAVDKVGNLVEKAADMAPMMLASGYVGVAIGVASLFSGASKSNSPYPAIFEMLKQISRQIDDLKVTLTNKLDRMDVRFGNLLHQTILLSEAIKGDTLRIQTQLNALSNKLNQVNVAIRDGQFATIEYLLSKDDDGCFQYSGDREPTPPLPNFKSCKSAYINRANVLSRSVLAPASVVSSAKPEWGETDQLFPDGDQYEKLREALQIPSTLDGRPLANPTPGMRRQPVF